MRKILFALLMLSTISLAAQTTVEFTPSKDNSIYSESNNSNGVGRLFAGQNNMGNNRRALLQFDVSSIPNTAIITEVTLRLNVAQASSATADPFSLHRLTTDWGEGISNGGGSGSAPVAPDATWTDAMLGTTFWTTSGADFIGAASSTTVFPTGLGETLITSTDDLVADVQSWIDDNNTNFGWIVIGDEANANSTRSFDSKDQGSLPPLLSITYVEPVTAMLTPVQDNTIYSESNNSNGQGRLFAGQNNMGNNRRALLQFDTSSIPNDATITGISLILNIDQVSSSTANTFNLHRVTTAWGEGTSNGGGSGTTAVAPDATWTDAMLGTAFWLTAGGDFDNMASATESLPAMTGDVTFDSTSNLIADVQNWVDGSTINNGWILIGDESSSGSTRRFRSRENVGNEPTLVITYSTALSIPEIGDMNALSIFPNPSDSGRFNISARNEVISIEVYNVLGKLLKQLTDLSNTEFTLDLSAFDDGLYLIKVIDLNNNSVVKRLIRK